MNPESHPTLKQNKNSKVCGPHDVKQLESNEGGYRYEDFQTEERDFLSLLKFFINYFSIHAMQNGMQVSPTIIQLTTAPSENIPLAVRSF